MKKSSIQDTLLNQCRKNNIVLTIYTNNGFPIKGKVDCFDDYTVLIVSAEKGYQQKLIYKSAISTIEPSRPVDMSFKEAAN